MASRSKSEEKPERHNLDHLLSEIEQKKVGLPALLAELVHMVQHKHAVNVNKLKDKGWRKIHESLFTVAIAEKHALLATTFNAVRAHPSKGRLEHIASALRKIVELGPPNLSIKSLDAIIDHITQTLPSADGKYCQPLILDYLKALISILGHQPNVERLSKDRWLAAVEFCVDGIDQYIDDCQHQSSIFAHSSSGTRGRSLATRSLARSPSASSNGTSDSTSKGHAVHLSKSHVIDLLQMLHSLVTPMNAPLSMAYESIMQCAISYWSTLAQSQSVGVDPSFASLFSIINSVVSYTRTDRTAFTEATAQDILPIITQFWQSKSVAKDEGLNKVRDEMLMFMFAVHPHLEKCIRAGQDLLTMLEELSDVLKADYTRRAAKDQLQIDDLEMADFGSHNVSTPFHLQTFQLRAFNIKGERNWAHLEVIGILERLVRLGQQQMSLPEEEKEMELDTHLRKRQKLTQSSDRVSDSLKDQDEKTRLAGLQILSFVLAHQQLTAPALEQILRQLHVCAGDKRGNIAPWALVAIASCTLQDASSRINSALWMSHWRIGTRALTFSNTCRAAALQLHAILANRILLYRDIGEDINAIIVSADVSGPVILCDASIFLMMHLLHTRVSEAPSASLMTSQHTIRWLFAKWNPSDRSFATRGALHVQPYQVINLLRVTLGLSRLPSESASILPLGSLAQTWQRFADSESIIRYVLLLDASTLARRGSRTSCPKTPENCIVAFVLDTAHFNSARRLILELLLSKSSELLQSWKSNTADNTSPVSADTFRSAIGSCLIMLLAMPHFSRPGLQQLPEFESCVQDLCRELIAFLDDAEVRDPVGAHAFAEALVQCVQPYLPECRLDTYLRLPEKYPHLLEFFMLITKEATRHRSPRTQSTSGNGDDPMDLDDDFGDFSQQSHSRSDAQKLQLPRQLLALDTLPASFDHVVYFRLLLVEAMNLSAGVSEFIPRSFIDKLIAMSNEELLLSHSLLSEMFRSDLAFHVEDGGRLLVRVFDALDSAEFERCEIAWVMSLECVIGLAPLWLAQEPDSNFATDALDMYKHLVGGALTDMFLSSTSQRLSATLLLGLMKDSAEFGSHYGLASPRTLLFTLMKETDLSVKFYIADHLASIFVSFVLEDHDSVFLDIMNNLPDDDRWLEGMCFRIFVFAKLASSLVTLQRRCIYHIVEIPPRLPDCLGHATKCLSNVSSALKLASPLELFSLFGKQIIYTWIDTKQDIADMPFQVFGFSSLRDLVCDARSEFVGILMMLNRDEEVKEVARILGEEEQAVLEASFTVIMAYTVGYDTYTPGTPSPGEQKYIAGDRRFKARLGPEKFLPCLNLHFADIMALWFTTCDPRDSLDKYLKKKEAVGDAARIMAEIKSLTAKRIGNLPPPSQPCFPDKYLYTQIDHLCKKTEVQGQEIYTPALVTFIARRVTNTIHPALGSLHACWVLRKIRTLICFAGKAATSGYPLEMLLQIFQPFIKDPQCATDAAGITQYLLTSGAKYLNQVPSFVAGLALSILGSLKEFNKVGQASSTQESQYQSTVSRLSEFRDWFGKYLTDYAGVSKQEELGSLFKSALDTNWEGNANAGTNESDLLKRLLEDELKVEPLLSRPSRELALEMLCSDFHAPHSFRTDVLGDDEDSVSHAVVVWKSCRKETTSKKYLSWAARVLGRAFASSGIIDQELLRESTLSEIRKQSSKSRHAGVSEYCIFYLLQELTLGHNKDHVGLAESALRLVLSNADEVLYQKAQECLSRGLRKASEWEPFQVPPSETYTKDEETEYVKNPYDEQSIHHREWVQALSIKLAKSVQKDSLLSALTPVLKTVPGFAEQAFPFIIHLVLSTNLQDQQDAKARLSTSFSSWFDNSQGTDKNNLKVLINAVLYLRTQQVQEGSSSADRLRWLGIDYMKAATAAVHCGMHKTALLFVEEHHSTPGPTKSSRRSSVREGVEPSEVPVDLLLDIFQNIDDLDMYYGVQQKSSLNTILARFEYEKDGPRSLAFRGAQYDSHIRRGDPEADKDAHSLVKALDVLSLSGLSHSLLQAQQSVGMSATSIESMFRTARKLEQWDIPVPDVSTNNAVAVYKAYQSINIATDQATIRAALDESFDFAINSIVRENLGASDLHNSLQALAALVEMDEVFATNGSQQIEDLLARFEARSRWMKTGSFDDVSQILSCRGTTLSTLSQRPRLQSLMNVKLVDTRLVEVRASLIASTLNRAHNALQESLSLATSMMDLIAPCQELSLNLEAAIHIEAANALWDQGETNSSIGILQALDNPTLLKKQVVPVNRSDLLSKISHQVSVARLEKADKILERYLRPALKELKNRIEGTDAGEVFHQFAIFCDQQLQDPDSLEDLLRLQKLSQGKQEEIDQIRNLLKTAPPADQQKLKNHFNKAKAWHKLDKAELDRHMSSREEFLAQSLENYLLTLIASDDHDSVALRFTALWLEHADEELATEAVLKYLAQVPSRKFAPLMNQLTSRLQDSPAKFQKLLFDLVLRICTDHPYHGMYQIYAGGSSRPNTKDDAAVSRKNATLKVASRLSQSASSGRIWANLSTINKYYVALAGEKDEAKYRSGRKIALKESHACMRLHVSMSKYRVPSPTLHLPLAADLDYSKIPVMYALEQQMTIASGVSAPKIITAIADNGQRFKQLVKGGNDDLRQDAIMEQVFEQVSELLKSNRSTRQRDLKIRTYKVLPLNSIAGVIEFVPNTIPLHEYLMPAHERYYPKDLTGSKCRKEIGDVQTQSLDVRVKKFRAVTDRFHPVMRYFFTEKFTDPDEWFVKRNAYTRSTAAISILGHVLGLGDRHGHNILLDSESGEVVHIDLGVAFEMGRVLPVPELVPFRLTRDIIDGMGITKTEGVFRRCCEFTLEALRKEVYSIMTILDVLRHDPLHNWSISPVRLAKLQEGQSALNAAGEPERIKEAVNEPGEADRALTVVNKKLSKTLSVQATVADLINQASDERNLAVLYSGWAAYA